MISWLRANHRDIVAYSRLIIIGCGAALIGIASLPRTTAWRIVADIGLVGVAFVFLLWLGVALAAVLRPVLLREPPDHHAEPVADHSSQA